MRLVQKLPIGLAVACMMLISCSKEDVQTPAPQTERTNIHSNEKLAVTPFISSTKTEYLGIDLLPNNWYRNNAGFSNDLINYPTGVSNRFKLWGDPSIPFVYNMSVVPGASSITEFITVTTAGTWSNASKSSVKTKITGLLPGKKYALTVYVGSSLPKTSSYKPYPTFAKSCLLTVGAQKTVMDLSIYYNCWVQKVITFTASAPQMDFTFSASPGQPGQYAYAHLLVPYAAIKQVN